MNADVTSSAPNDANLDQDEVRRFADQAAEWWDPDGSFRPLHKIGPARITFIRDRLLQHFGMPSGGMRPLKGLSILDVGCGGGLICEPLCRLGATVTGIDPGQETVSAARSHAAQQGLDIEYCATTIEDLAEAGDSFDVVLALEVLEHVPDPTGFVRTCGELVRPGGAMIVSTINRTAKSYALAIVAAEYVLRWLPRGTHDWEKFLTLDQVRVALETAGLEDVMFDGISFNALRDTWHLSSDTDVNFIAIASKPSARAG
ncbi:MAG: bifunctional 2-polyprenyl-6-hydroxyphenol methylase/3-demethylubiquinol 3-O-methyltransferase UbiG [Pseudomonadota bacterium]